MTQADHDTDSEQEFDLCCSVCGKETNQLRFDGMQMMFYCENCDPNNI